MQNITTHCDTQLFAVYRSTILKLTLLLIAKLYHVLLKANYIIHTPTDTWVS